MKTLKKSFTLFILILLLFPVGLISQNFEDFQKSVLVDIPGDNYDFSLKSDQNMVYPLSESYITWVNKSDSIYSVYLKRVSPETLDSNVIIASDDIVKSNPQIVRNSSGPGITVVWENFQDSYYRIVRRDYYNGSLSDEVILRDSLNDDPQITMTYNYLAWVTEGTLYLKELFPDTSSAFVIDSETSSPALVREDWGGPPPLLYEKSVNGNLCIYLAIYHDYPAPYWEYFDLSDGYNPGFGAGSGISLEITEDGISRIKYYPYPDPDADFYITKNTGCNYKNPDIFSYPIPTNRPDEDTPFFIVFDTDSLQNNNEVMVQTVYYWPDDLLINISDMEGDDSNPKADVMLYDDIAYVVIVWEHNDGVHGTIWMAKTIYHPAGGVKDDGAEINSFDLLQNYPNPFNPVTKIEYNVPVNGYVSLKIYDMLGREVSVLVNKEQSPGRYSVDFDALSAAGVLASGVYIYRLTAGKYSASRKLVLLK